MHADEVEYIFGHPLNSTLQYRQRERDLSRMMVQSVSKFARTGWVITAFMIKRSLFCFKKSWDGARSCCEKVWEPLFWRFFLLLIFRNPSLDGKHCWSFSKAFAAFKFSQFVFLSSQQVFTGLFTKQTIQFITLSTPKGKRTCGLTNTAVGQQQHHVLSGMISYRDWEIGVSWGRTVARLTAHSIGRWFYVRGRAIILVFLPLLIALNQRSAISTGDKLQSRKEFMTLC